MIKPQRVHDVVPAIVTFTGTNQHAVSRISQRENSPRMAVQTYVAIPRIARLMHWQMSHIGRRQHHLFGAIKNLKTHFRFKRRLALPCQWCTRRLNRHQHPVLGTIAQHLQIRMRNQHLQRARGLCQATIQ